MAQPQPGNEAQPARAASVTTPRPLCQISGLDVHCKAHELVNLCVVDTSFFPSIGAMTPR
jgi:hypothetical protein